MDFSWIKQRLYDDLAGKAGKVVKDIGDRVRQHKRIVGGGVAGGGVLAAGTMPGTEEALTGARRLFGIGKRVSNIADEPETEDKPCL